MAGVPEQIPEELHDTWTMWHDHYRATGSSPRRAREEATASVSAHYLEPLSSAGGTGARRTPRGATGPGPYAPERWQTLCPHCGAVAHADLTCAQASAGSLIALERPPVEVEGPRPNSPEDLGWRAA